MLSELIPYEIAYLEQELSFHVALIAKFSQDGVRFVRRDHDRRSREFMKGDAHAVVYVWDGQIFRREEAVTFDYR